MPAYDQQAVRDLTEATLYESWLLEAAYSIAEDSLFFSEWPDQIIYPPNGGEAPPLTNFGRCNAVMGDWRPEFLRVGAPLIFVTTFKLLDMLVEWALSQNGQTVNYRFTQKINALRGELIFPPFIASRDWLQKRLIALYESLEPLRGTIIHARHFNTADGALNVSSSRGNNIGPIVSLTSHEIRLFTVVIVSVLRYVDGTWQSDNYREKLLRRSLDELTHLHCLPSLNQLPPHLLTARVYFIRKDAFTIDIDRIQHDVNARLPGHDIMINLRLVAVDPDGSCATSYLLPWDMLQDETGSSVRLIKELASYETSLPSDFDVQEVIHELVTHIDAQRIVG